jgi:hypothetical protein
MSPLSHAAEKQLVHDTKLTGFVDLWIGMRGAPDRKLIVHDGITFVPATQKGEVGVVDVTWDEDGHPSMAQRLEVVSDQLPADTHVQEAVSAYYARESRRLQEASLQRQIDWRQAGFESSQRCAECHSAQMRQWSQSKHRQAAETLRAKDRLVAECLRCHSEWYRRTNTFQAEQSLAWGGVECSTCHGPGVVHSALRDKESIIRKVDEKTCRQCHDPQNDPKFDFQSYLEKIRHW